MTQDMLKGLTDAELEQTIVLAQDELTARAELRKRQTLAKIKEMAQTVGVQVSIQSDRRKKGHQNKLNRLRSID